MASVKLISKAWSLDILDYDENWFIHETVFMGDSCGKAKYKALNYLRSDDFKRIDEQDICLTNIRLSRSKEYDTVEYNGKQMKRFDLERCLRIEERDKSYVDHLENNPNSFAHIVKRGSYYLDNYNGYTDIYHFGAIYPLKDAIEHVKGCDDSGLHLNIIHNVEKHNERINEAILKLQHRLI